MKSITNKTIILLIFSLLLLIASGCENSDDVQGDNSWQDDNPSYLTMSEFESIVNKEKIINFDSIIPNSEVAHVAVRLNDDVEDFYAFLYTSEAEGNLYIDVRRIEKGNTIEKIYDSSFLNSELYDSFDDITVTNETTGRFLCEISGTKIVRKYYEGKLDEVCFVIDDYCFSVAQFEFANTEAQKEFVKAFETDDSVIEMLDKIKALIPKS